MLDSENRFVPENRFVRYLSPGTRIVIRVSKKMVKPRAKLSASDAISIYKLKSKATSAMSVAKTFKVCEKTVRDVWKGRTWAKETWHLDTARPLKLKRAGRPRGSKDLKPRKQRHTLNTTTTRPARTYAPPEMSLAMQQPLSEPFTSIHSAISCFHSPIAAVTSEKTSLDDFLFHMEFEAESTDGDPFARDWAIALQTMQRIS